MCNPMKLEKEQAKAETPAIYVGEAGWPSFPQNWFLIKDKKKFCWLLAERAVLPVTSCSGPEIPSTWYWETEKIKLRKTWIPPTRRSPQSQCRRDRWQAPRRNAAAAAAANKAIQKRFNSLGGRRVYYAEPDSDSESHTSKYCPDNNSLRFGLITITNYGLQAGGKWSCRFNTDSRHRDGAENRFHLSTGPGILGHNDWLQFWRAAVAVAVATDSSNSYNGYFSSGCYSDHVIYTSFCPPAHLSNCWPVNKILASPFTRHKCQQKREQISAKIRVRPENQFGWNSGQNEEIAGG